MTARQGCTHSRGLSGWLHVRPELDLWVGTHSRGCQIGYTCDQNSTYGLALGPGGCQVGYTNGSYRLSSSTGV
jgi:hypothetical protein